MLNQEGKQQIVIQLITVIRKITDSNKVKNKQLLGNIYFTGILIRE